MDKFEQLPWALIIGLGALALIRPLLNITGLMDALGRPLGPLLVTGLISLAWLVIVVWVRPHQLLLTLVCTGVVYGIFALVLSAFLSPILTGRWAGPLTNPWATVAVLVTNGLWGAMVGLIGLGIRQVENLGAKR